MDKDEIFAAVKAIPGYFGARFWRWIASLHEPLAVGEPHYTWCANCKQPWPCKLWMQATDEAALLTKGSES